MINNLFTEQLNILSIYERTDRVNFADLGQLNICSYCWPLYQQFGEFIASAFIDDAILSLSQYTGSLTVIETCFLQQIKTNNKTMGFCVVAVEQTNRGDRIVTFNVIGENSICNQKNGRRSLFCTPTEVGQSERSRDKAIFYFHLLIYFILAQLGT